MNKSTTILYWISRIVAALIMAQTLYFKFTGAEESVYIFTTVGMEPWGRIGVGIIELIAAVLLLVNSVAWIGGGIALGLMGGAIMMHIFILGLSVKGDGGQLFLYAVIVTLCSAYVLYVNREKVVGLLKLFRSRPAKLS